MENYEAKVLPDHVIGFTEKGQYTGTRILPNGRTAKITVNDYVTNGSLTPPPDISNPILVGVIVHEDSHYSEDNRARIITPNKRVRTYESIEYTESYTKGDTAESVSPKL